MIRIKLIFDDNILIAEEFRKIWFLIPDTVQYVSDLAYLIRSKFCLKNECPNGLNLTLDEFTLPPTQNINLIRDNDAVTVRNHRGTKRKRDERSAENSEPETGRALDVAQRYGDVAQNTQTTSVNGAESDSDNSDSSDHSDSSDSSRKDESSDSDSSSASSARVESSNHAPSTTSPAHIIFGKGKSLAAAETPKQTAHAQATPTVPVQQRRGQTLGRGYRPPQWPWQPFTLMTDEPRATEQVYQSAAPALALASLQRDDVIAFRTMELDGWQPVVSPVKQATVLAAAPHSVTVRLLTPVTEDADEVVTLSDTDVLELTLVNKVHT